MAVVVPSIFASSVLEATKVDLEVAKLATDVTDMVEEIKNAGDTVHFPIIAQPKMAEKLTPGTDVTPDRVNMTDSTAKIVEIGLAQRVLDSEEIQVKGGLMDKIVVGMGRSMAQKIDYDLIDAMDKEAVYKVATGSATDLTVVELESALLKFGDKLNKNDFSAIVVNSRIYPAFMKMDDFVSASKTFAVDGSGIVENNVLGYWRGIKVVVSDNNTYDTSKNECKTYIIKKDALGYVMQKEIGVEEQRNVLGRSTDILTNCLMAVKVMDTKGIVLLRKTIA